MIAALKVSGIGETFHAVYWTGRQGLVSVKTSAYCGLVADSGDGVFQVPNGAINCPECRKKLTDAEAKFPVDDFAVQALVRQVNALAEEVKQLKARNA